MPLTKLEYTTVLDGCNAARVVTDQLYPLLKRLNIAYDAQGGAKETVTQQNLDATPAFSGLTKAQLDDGMYALTATLRGAVEAAYAQLAELAIRGG